MLAVYKPFIGRERPWKRNTYPPSKELFWPGEAPTKEKEKELRHPQLKKLER